MTIQKISYFLSAAELLNLRKAAHIHYITVSTIARQISSLEEHLGVKLFERSNSGLKLTEAGERFYPIARDILHLLHGYRHKMQKYGYTSGGPGPEFVIAHGAFNGTYYALYQLVDNYLSSWLKKACRLHCVREDMMIDMVRSEFAQIGVTSEAHIHNNKAFESVFFFRSNCVLFIPKSHPLAARDSIDFSELIQIYNKYGHFLPKNLDLSAPSTFSHDRNAGALIGVLNDSLRQKPIQTAGDIEILCDLWNRLLLPLMDYSGAGVMETGHAAIIVLPEGTRLPVLREMHCVHIGADAQINWHLFWKKNSRNPDIEIFKEAFACFGTNFSFRRPPGQSDPS